MEAKRDDNRTTEIACKVLLVDDSPMVLRLLTNLLQALGQPVYTARNVGDAMKIVEEQHPGLVISDWEMPQESGLDLCRRLRKSETFRDVHFIMLTTHSDDSSLLEAYNAGVDDFVGKPFKAQELLARARVGVRTFQLREELNQRTALQESANSLLAELNNRLNQLSITDELTGLYNRRHAMFRLEEEWALSARHQRPLAVAMIDIDHFKSINDRWGHEAGDGVLRELANFLRSATRTSDLAFRIGGEEMLLIFPSQTAKEAVVCAERFREAVARHVFRVEHGDIHVTVSVGLAGVCAATKGAPDLLRVADEMLYSAKRAGRNRVQVDPNCEALDNPARAKCA